MEYRNDGRSPAGSLDDQSTLSPEEVKVVLDVHTLDCSVLQTAKNLYNRTSHRCICYMVQSNYLIVSSSAKARRQRWIRYGRPYSSAMWHTNYT